jgi:hypothetical protein
MLVGRSPTLWVRAGTVRVAGDPSPALTTILEGSMSEENPSGWAAGWAAFAGVMLIMIGVFQSLAGLVAIIDDEYYVIGPNYTWELDTTTWGWIHLLVGIVVLLSGIGIFSGNVAARTVGVLVAVVSAVANFMWLPYYPVGSVIIIAVNIAVIWALTAHGRDITAAS